MIFDINYKTWLNSQEFLHEEFDENTKDNSGIISIIINIDIK